MCGIFRRSNGRLFFWGLTMVTKKKAVAKTVEKAAPTFAAGDSVRVLAGDFGTGKVQGQDDEGAYLVDLDKYKGTDFGPVKFRGSLLTAA